VNSDSAYLSKAEVRNVMTGRFELLAVGTGCEADMALEEIRAQGLSVHFRLENKTNGEKQEVALSVPGRHNAWNAALAAACGIKLGVTLEQSAAALETVRQTERRLSVSEAAGVTLIDDTYNAGPDSMRAALTVLSDLQGKRRIAVLADILELGSMREEGHKSVGRAVACVAPDILLAVGENAAYYISGAQEAGFRGVSRLFRDSAQAFEWLKPKISAGDVILVKGSNATGVSKVACDIRTLIESEEDM